MSDQQATTTAAPEATTTAPAQTAQETTPISLALKEGKLFVGDDALDLSPEDLKNIHNLKKGSYSKFEEASRLRKEAEEKLSKLDDVDFLTSDPDRLKKLEQHFIDKLAREYEEAQAEQMRKDDLLSKNLDPEQVELLMEAQKILQENKRLKETQEAEVQKRQELEREQALAEYNKAANEAYTDALKQAGLKPTPRNLAAMRDYHISVIGSEAEDSFSELDLSNFVKENTVGEVRETVSDLADEELVEFLGEDLVKRINKVYASRIQKLGVQVKKDPDAAEEKREIANVLRTGFGFGI